MREINESCQKEKNLDKMAEKLEYKVQNLKIELGVIAKTENKFYEELDDILAEIKNELNIVKETL